MSNFLTSSIGKKVIMSLSGIFLVTFVCIHLGVNALLFFGEGAYNAGCEVMAWPIIKYGLQPVLALGFLIHIFMASFLTVQNRKARPVKYAVRNQSGNCEWSSRNMYVLGALIIAFLCLHMTQFWAKMQFADVEPNAYLLVSSYLSQPIYAAIYAIAGILLGMHLAHGFWSMFQSIGFSNNIWRKRLECLGKLFAYVVIAGFVALPLFFALGLNNCCK